MARLFNGTSDQIKATANGTVFATGQTWSASSWFYLTALPATGVFYCILAKRDNTNGAFCEIYVQDVSGTTGFGAFNGQNFKAFGTIATGQWYQGTVACDASASTVYINTATAGVDARSYLTGTGQVNSTAAPLCVGVDYGNGPTNLPQDFFQGRIADCALWLGVKLTAAEAAALGKGARPNTIRPQNLTVWYPLDGIQSPEIEFSGKGYNGTLTGTVAAPGPPETMFTPHWPNNELPSSAPAATVKFRKTSSRIGTRTGTRQTV